MFHFFFFFQVFVCFTMVFGDGVANTTITVGQVNHVMKSEFLLRCPTGSPLANFVKNLRKGIKT